MRKVIQPLSSLEWLLLLQHCAAKHIMPTEIYIRMSFLLYLWQCVSICMHACIPIITYMHSYNAIVYTYMYIIYTHQGHLM